MALALVLRRIFGGLVLAASLAAGVLAEPRVTLSPAEMHAATVHAMRIGDHTMALRLADALLIRDPDDVQALAARARALRNLGEYAASRQAARRVWALADTDADRYAAALLIAQAQSSIGRRLSAQLWLRRAGQNAPTEAARARAVQDFRYVQSRNPWQTRLSFGVTPSSNVNNGSEADTVTIAGLPFALSPSAKALSGQELRADAALQYRIRRSETLQLHAEGQVRTRSYRLSDAARAQAPGLRNGDLAWQAVELRFGGHWASTPGAGPYGAEITLGKSFYGGAPLADYARLEVSKSMSIAPRTILKLTGAAERQWRADAAINDASVATGAAQITRRRGNGDLVMLSVDVSDTRSDGASIAHESGRVALDYRLSEPIFGARLALSASYERRDYDRGRFGAPPREDDRVSLGASLLLPQVEYYGFAPEIGLVARRTGSNLPLYRTEELGLTLGFRSTF